MTTTKTVVKTDSINVKDGLEPSAAPASGVKDGLAALAFVDKTALGAAMVDHAAAIAAERDHLAATATLRKRIDELQTEIADVETALALKPNASMDIAAIKQYADNKRKFELQLEAFNTVRNDLISEVSKMERDNTGFFYGVSDAKRAVWQVIYDGLLESIDREPLELLLTAGVMIGMQSSTVISDLELDNDTRRLEAMVKHFNLPG